MNTDIDLIDFMDLINFTLHKDFVEKWRYKYSEKFVKHFQIKILESLNKQKVIKLSSLYNYLTKKCRYSGEQVDNFFISIDIFIYYPLIINDKSRQKWDRRSSPDLHYGRVLPQDVFFSWDTIHAGSGTSLPRNHPSSFS